MAETYGFEIDFDDLDFEFSSGDGVNTRVYSKFYDGFEIDFDDLDFEFSSGGGVNRVYFKFYDGFEIDFNDLDFEFSSGDGVIINTIYQYQNGIGFILNITGKFYDYGDTMFEVLLDEDLGTRKKSKLIPVLRK